MPRYRVPFLAADNEPTDDGRVFEVVGWRDLPLPLAAQFDTQHTFEGTSDVVGQLVDISKGDDGVVTAVIDVDPQNGDGAPIHPDGARAAACIEAGGQGISIDGLIPPDATVEEECLRLDDDGWCESVLLRFSAATIGGATLTPIPAYSRAIVDPTPLDAADPAPVVEPDEAMAAAGGPVAPPAAWFADPVLAGPTPVTVGDDGRVLGHLALWGTCHTSVANSCLTPPRSAAGYAHFRTGEVLADDGSRVACGALTFDTGHAPTSGPGSGLAATLAHYDHTGTAWADVAAGEDAHGIWVAGAARPGLTDEQLRTIRASALSGDWRRIGGALELVAALSVNVPGFPVPRAGLAASGREPLALVAAGSAAVQQAADGAPACSCGGGVGHDTSGTTTALSPAQSAALARLAAKLLDEDLAEVDRHMALADLPASL